MITDFLTWFTESHQHRIPSTVLDSYEHEFRRQLQGVISRIENPTLKANLEQMLQCPLRDARGNCRGFAEFIYSALLRNGIHHRYDMEAALQYVIEKMLLTQSDNGQPKISLFAGFREKPDYSSGNPLLARFLAFLEGAVRNIRKGRIPRLLSSRQQGIVSIGLSRAKRGETPEGISPDEIPGRVDMDTDLGEMIEDLEGLLRRKERASGLPLVAMFRATMAGQTTVQQRRTFGDRKARAGRQVVLDTIEEYAKSSGNAFLLHLLARLKNDKREEGGTPSRKPVKPVKPVLSEKERDYRSIAEVIARFDRPVGTADLGRYRRRWLEYPARNPDSGHRNRLSEVLARMVEDGVLRATRTSAGALVYSAGPHFQQYRADH